MLPTSIIFIKQISAYKHQLPKVSNLKQQSISPGPHEFFNFVVSHDKAFFSQKNLL